MSARNWRIGLVVIALSAATALVVALSARKTSVEAPAQVAPTNTVKPERTLPPESHLAAPEAMTRRDPVARIQLHARAVDELGAPLVGMKLVPAIRAHEGFVEISRVTVLPERPTTSADGSFALELPSQVRMDGNVDSGESPDAKSPGHKPLALLNCGGFELVLTEANPMVGPDFKLDPREAVLALTPDAPSDRVVRDLVFTRPPLLVGGFVTDSDERLVVGANVTVFETTFPEKGSSLIVRELARTVTDERGRFSIRTSTEAQELDVVVRADALHQCGSESGFARGASNLHVVLRPLGVGKSTWFEGSITLRVLTAPGTAHLVQAQLRLNREPVVVRNLNYEGQVSFLDLRAGTACIDLVQVESEFRLAHIDDLIVPQVGACADPRLTAIDVSELLVWTRARLMTPFDQPLANADARVENDEGQGIVVRTDADGWFSLPVPKDMPKLAVRVDGYRRVNFTRDDTIRLIIE